MVAAICKLALVPDIIGAALEHGQALKGVEAPELHALEGIPTHHFVRILEGLALPEAEFEIISNDAIDHCELHSLSNYSEFCYPILAAAVCDLKNAKKQVGIQCST